MAEKTFEFNGNVMTIEELNEKMAELASLQKLQKEAKKAGVITKAVKVEKEKPAEIALLIEAFKPVVEANLDCITPLFANGIDGLDSVSFNVNDDYIVIIRDRKVMKAKAEARKENAKAEAKPE